MARTSAVSIAIYRRHLYLYRFLNDAWIFTDIMRPPLLESAQRFRRSTSRAKKSYKVPKKDGWIDSRRRDDDIAQVIQAQYERGVFEANLVNAVSRLEAFIQECMTIAIKVYPRKLALLGEGGSIPLDMFLEHEEREQLLERYVEARCQSLMFGKPRDYLAKAAKVLSIELHDDAVSDYIEIKASRDIVVHGLGMINKIYLEKAGEKARGALDAELPIDRDYFRHVIVTAKRLSGQIQAGTERTYG